MGPLSRAPDAHVLRARHLAEHWDETRPVHRYEHPSVLGYAKFLYDLRTVDVVQQERYFATYGTLSAVHSLILSGQELSSFSFSDPQKAEKSKAITPEQRDRGLIKALVVANAPTSYIAEMLSYTEVTICAFEFLAWDVRSRLKARGWLHNHVFAGGLYQETSLSDYEGMCVHTAYTHGLAGVERLLGLTPSESAEEMELFQAQFASELSRKAVVALRSLPLNSHTGPEVVTGYIQMSKNAQEGARRDRELNSRGGKGSGDVSGRLVETLGQAGLDVAKGTVQYEGPPEEQRSSVAFLQALEELAAVGTPEVSR